MMVMTKRGVGARHSFLRFPIAFKMAAAEGYVPDVLKSSIVNPLPTVSPPQEVKSDLRQIAVTCTIVKVMEGFARSRLITQIAENIDPLKYTREGHSTVGIAYESTSYNLFMRLQTRGNREETFCRLLQGV